jgi:hypothetical protein
MLLEDEETSTHQLHHAMRTLAWSSRFVSLSRSHLCKKQFFASVSHYTSCDDKLSKLRALMKLNRFDAYLVPMSDPHLSEYISDCYARLQYLSHFTGSAGTVVVTSSHAFLWTDGRSSRDSKQSFSSINFLIIS